MGGYAGTGQATLLRENRQMFLFHHESGLAGRASIAIQPERNRGVPPSGLSLQIYFTDVNGNPADPGVFDIEIQESDIDQDSQYCTTSTLGTGGLSTTFVGRVEVPVVFGKYVRVLITNLTNFVYTTVQVTDFPGSGGGDGGGAGNFLTEAAADVLYVNVTGDTMTGPLELPSNPTQPLEAATKQYVDSSIAASALYQGTWQVAANVPNLNIPPAAPLNGYSWTAQTVNPLVPETAPASILGIGNQSVHNGDTVRWSAALNQYENIQGSGLTSAEANALYVDLTGDTMTGPLVLAADPTAPLQAATKQYVDAGDATGAALANTKVAKTGDTMTGLLMLSANPTAPLGAATKQYADSQDALRVAKTGDTMTGPLVLPADPTAALQAATKQYVDSTEATLNANKVAKAGDTMTGSLVLQGDPTANLQAATKQYVDTAVATQNLYQGLWQVAANTPNLNVPPNSPLNGYSWIAQTVDPNVAETAPATIPGIGGLTIFNGDTIKWSSALSQYQRVQGSSLTSAQADILYVNTSGDTMTGPLMLASDPAVALQAATKGYVDTGDAAVTAIANSKVAKVGDTMTGPLGLPADPTQPLEATTKQYVDNNLSTGLALKVNKTGDTMTGPLTLPANPTLPLQAATKQYVDTTEATINANKVAKAGDTMTGALILSGDPTQLLQATTKQYVDVSIAQSSLYQGIWHVAANTPDLTPAVAHPLNGYSWLAQTANPSTPETAPAGLPGIGGKSIAAGNTVRWNAATTQYELIQSGGLDLTTANSLYVDITGDTMTGVLTLAADPVSNLQAATKQYVDTAAATLNTNKVAKAGDTMTGNLLLDGDGVAISINKHATSGRGNVINGSTGGAARWGLYLGGGQNETGANVGSDFQLLAWNDAGNVNTPVFDITRSGAATVFPTLSTNIQFNNDGQGVFFNSGGAIYKKSGTGIVIREHTNGTQPQIENNDGTNLRPILDSLTGVLKTGDTMTGNLAFSGANLGVTFPGGSKVYDWTDKPLTLTQGTSNAQPQIRDNNGGNARNIIDSAGGTINGQLTMTNNLVVTNSYSYFCNANTNSSYTNSILYARDQSNRNLWALLAYQSGNVVGGNPEGQLQLYTNNGGWAWQQVMNTTTNSPPQTTWRGNLNAPAFTVTSSASLKENIRYLASGEIASPFERIKVVKYCWRDRPWPVDAEGNRLAEMPEQPEEWKRDRIGFIIDDLVSDSDLKQLVFGQGEDAGYDLGQVLALTVAKVQALESELGELRKPWYRKMKRNGHDQQQKQEITSTLSGRLSNWFMTFRTAMARKVLTH